MKFIALILLISTLSGAAVFGADKKVLSDQIKVLRKYQTDREEKLIKTTLPELEQCWKCDPRSVWFLRATMAINRKKEEALNAMYKEIEEHRDVLISQYSNVEFPEIKQNYIWDRYNIRKTDICLKS